MPETREQILLRRAEALEYVQSMLGQLRKMAAAERYDMVAYLIEMAFIEATDVVRGDRSPRIHADPLREDERNSAA
jgi:translation elongation factor EF-Tu-like GTPase